MIFDKILGLKSRIKKLEEKTGGKNFAERMQAIFSTESFYQLTSQDVEALIKFMPDKYKILSDKICNEMQERI